MKTLSLTSCLGVTLISSTYAAVMSTESFSGTGNLSSPNNSGDHTGPTYSITVSEIKGDAEISFEVSITVGGGPVHFDTRGFGDSANSNDAFQTTPVPAQTMTIQVGAVSATALNGATLISNGVTAEFTSIDVVNNGGSSPAISWSTDIPSSGTTTSTGTSSGFTVTENGITGATSIDITATANWMWINNAQFSYSGDVVTEQVPEPSSILLTGLAALGFLRRRRA